jgi:hypothetical protein
MVARVSDTCDDEGLAVQQEGSTRGFGLTREESGPQTTTYYDDPSILVSRERSEALPTQHGDPDDLEVVA